MTQQALVGVDMGTTSIKALCVAVDGTVLAEASAPTPWRHDGPLADADPVALAQTAIDVCARAAEAAGEVEVRGLGVTGIAESGALIDSQGRPCAPMLAWFDPRGDAASLRERIEARDFQRATGRRLNSKPSIAKIRWLQDNIPGASSAVRHLCVAEWVVRAMGGEEVAEASLSSRTGMLELAVRQPWGPAVASVGDLLPRTQIWAGDPAGTASGPELPAVLRGAALTVAGLDHQAAAFISGAVRDGALFDSMGTAEALVRTVGRPLSADDIEQLTDADIDVDWSVLPNHQILIGARLTGLTLERVAAMLGAGTREARRELGAAALAVGRGADAPRIVDLGNDSLTLGGITDGVSPALVWRSVVEDLTAMIGGALSDMSTVAGPISSSVVAGGWTRNAMVADAKVRQLVDPVFVDITEPGALGAAFLGGVAAGVLERPGKDGLPRWISA
jgi:sugar (pentulose or hexulose) kinase